MDKRVLLQYIEINKMCLFGNRRDKVMGRKRYIEFADRFSKEELEQIWTQARLYQREEEKK